MTFSRRKKPSEGVGALYDIVRKNPGLRTQEYSKILNVPIKTLEHWVKKMREENKINFQGATKTGGYHIS